MCQLTDQPPLQLEALRAIALFAPGPRVASTPRTFGYQHASCHESVVHYAGDSLLHPSQMHFKKLLFQEGALPVIFKLCESPVIEVMNQAVVCMGVFAVRTQISRVCREIFFLHSGESYSRRHTTLKCETICSRMELFSPC